MGNNPYLTQTDKDFFLLLRAGLWQKVEEPLSATPDWSYIYDLACEQTVQGIVADGIGLIKAAYDRGDFGNTPFPSGSDFENIYTQFLDQSAQIIRQNYKVNLVQARVCQLLDDNMPSSPSNEAPTASYFVVKGQEAAKNYPKPMLRCSGDIDILVPRDQFDWACETMRKYADCSEDFNAYLVHEGFFFGDIEVEIHGALHPRLGKGIDQVLDQLQEDCFAAKEGRPSPFKGEQEALATFNAVYVFLHCLQHLCWSGLGIRQIIDWAMLLANAKYIDYNRVGQTIKVMKIEREWNLFLSFAETYLGADFNEFKSSSFKGDKRVASLLWLTCRESGNMGHAKPAEDFSGNFLVRNFKRLSYDFSRYCRLHPLAPNIAHTQFLFSLRNYCLLFIGKHID